jgi:hypothetical protein
VVTQLFFLPTGVRNRFLCEKFYQQRVLFFRTTKMAK